MRILTPLTFTVLVLILLLPLTIGCAENPEDEEDDPEDINAPQLIKKFRARTFSDRIELKWGLPTEEDQYENRDIAGVLIVRGENERPFASPYREEEYSVGQMLGQGEIVYIGGEEKFTDTNVSKGVTYYYEAFTFDEIPNYSDSRSLNATPGSMIYARISHTQTVLDDGRVLLVGGIGYQGSMDNAEIFDPVTGEFSEVVSEMRDPRYDHTATLLDDGRVLIAGGFEEGALDTLMTAEIFDPTTEEFVWVDSKMSYGRANHTSTLLDDGRVLLTGGTDGINGYNSADIFDPSTNTFTSTSQNMKRERYGHTADLVTIAGESYVMIAGGFDGFTSVPYAVFYDPRTDEFVDFNGQIDNETSVSEGPFNHTSTVLDDGRVLIAGGYIGTLASGSQTDTCELFDENYGEGFAATGQLNQARSEQSAALLADGTVLIMGGISSGQEILASSEIFDPVSGTFEVTADLNFIRTEAAASTLTSGIVLVTGGNASTNDLDPKPVSAAEFFDPTTETFQVIGK